MNQSDIPSNIPSNIPVTENNELNNSSGNMYVDPSGNLYKKCNTSFNGEEYYTNDTQTLNVLSGTVSIPFLIGSIVCSIGFICLFSLIGLSIYKSSEKKMTVGMILTITCCLLCLASLIANIVNFSKAKNQIDNAKNNPEARPCYSEKQYKLIN